MLKEQVNQHPPLAARHRKQQVRMRLFEVSLDKRRRFQRQRDQSIVAANCEFMRLRNKSATPGKLADNTRLINASCGCAANSANNSAISGSGGGLASGISSGGVSAGSVNACITQNLHRTQPTARKELRTEPRSSCKVVSKRQLWWEYRLPCNPKLTAVCYRTTTIQ